MHELLTPILKLHYLVPCRALAPDTYFETALSSSMSCIISWHLFGNSII